MDLKQKKKRMEKQRKKSERKELSHWRLKDEKLKQKRKERLMGFKERNMTKNCEISTDKEGERNEKNQEKICHCS